MRILSFTLLSLFLLSSCDAIEDANPIKAITEGSGTDKDEELTTSSTTSQYLELMNNHRISLGLRALSLDKDMAAVATTHSQNMASGVVAFGHLGFSDRCNKTREIMGNGNLCGEIVAQGQSTYQGVFSSWLASPGHRAKIEEARYTHTGFGYFKSSKGVMFWTQVFLEVD
jgi:uncharacterized protein YkwD